MSIVFEAYSTGDGAFTARLPLHAVLTDTTNFVRARLDLIASMEGAQINDGVFSSPLPALHAVAFDRTGAMIRAALPLQVDAASNTLTPDLAIFRASLPQLTTNMHGAQTSDAQITGHMLLNALVTDATALFKPHLPLNAYFSDGLAAIERIAFLIQQPSLISTVTTGTTAALSDQFKGVETAGADFVHALMDLIRFSDTYSQLAQVVQALQDGMSVFDIARLIWEAGLVDTFVASAVPSGFGQITVMLADGMELADGANAISSILAALADGFYATLTLNTGNDIYTAWVMTPKTKAFRSYSNFPFNSYAKLGPHFLGAGDAGIYRLGGPTDDGVAIRSSIVTGLMDLGSESMSAVNKAYVGTTAAGALLMRVQATTYDGRLINQTYRMVPSVLDDARAMRIDVGRGFRSVYWKFELANDDDGAAFEVHDWQVLPVHLTGTLI